MNILNPALVVKSLSEINLKKYWETGKRGIILDLDNTITPWNEMELSQEAHVFLKEALDLKYKIFLLSNAKRNRTEAIAQKYAISYLAPALKPRKASFLKALELMNLKNEQVLVIGDQIFTDILGGNRVGCYTILVPPISQREFFVTKFFRLLETLFRH
ncbi:MAG: YqeG family HAD IIIA-type phosphatase [Clostridia bacterium]|nr:YqeG family HAD IIIA-type phosphatase [Clostridia bacterium]